MYSADIKSGKHSSMSENKLKRCKEKNKLSKKHSPDRKIYRRLFYGCVACVAGGIVGFSAHKQAAKPLLPKPLAAALLVVAASLLACARLKPNNTASYAG